jgi:hypothetical protein
MSFGSGYGNQPFRHGGMLASEADREATQTVLKQAFEDQRLTQEEFEARVGSALSARTQGELAQLTSDLPVPMTAAAVLPRRPRRRWVLPAVIAGVAVIGVILVLGLMFTTVSTTSTQSTSAGAPVAAPPPGGPAHCPVGTSRTAMTLADALARDPVYVEPGSSLLTPAEAGRLRAEIARADAGRIRMAALTPATVSRGGGERTLANAIASCPADAAGVTLVTTPKATYLVTSFPGDQAASQAVEAALNTHARLAPGLVDAAKRLAAVDPDRS